MKQKKIACEISWFLTSSKQILREGQIYFIVSRIWTRLSHSSHSVPSLAISIEARLSFPPMNRCSSVPLVSRKLLNLSFPLLDARGSHGCYVCGSVRCGVCAGTRLKKEKSCTRGRWNKKADVWKSLSPNPPSTWAGLYFSRWHTFPIYNVSVLWIGYIPGCPWVDFPKLLSLICLWRRPNSWLWQYKRLYFFFL